jgi:prepilin-type processing-associated H-X9-DG protein
MHRGILKVGALAVAALLLLGLFATIVVRWRETANRTRCQEHLRQLGWLAMWSYTDRDLAFPNGPDDPNLPLSLPERLKPDADRTFPPGTLFNAGLPPEQRLSWMVVLLPYMGKDDVYKKLDLALGWQAESNRAGISTLVPAVVCPSQYEAAAPGTPVVTNYIGMAGLGPDAPNLPQTDPRAGMLRYNDPTKVGTIRRGLSRTITILETPSDLGPWAAGGRATVRGLDPATAPYIGPGRPFGGHPAGANAAFADGSVRFQDASINARVLELMATLADRNVGD